VLVVVVILDDQCRVAELPKFKARQWFLPRATERGYYRIIKLTSIYNITKYYKKYSVFI
jgi:hypothetical protein